MTSTALSLFFLLPVQFHLPFDGTLDYHTFSIRWSQGVIVWSVDNRPIRILFQTQANPWPAKPLLPQVRALLPTLLSCCVEHHCVTQYCVKQCCVGCYSRALPFCSRPRPTPGLPSPSCRRSEHYCTPSHNPFVSLSLSCPLQVTVAGFAPPKKPPVLPAMDPLGYKAVKALRAEKRCKQS